MRRHTRNPRNIPLLVALALAAPVVTAPAAQAVKKPVKVFIMAGQSNMEGQGCIDFSERRTADYKRRGLGEDVIAGKRRGALEHLVRDPLRTERYRHIVDEKGDWVVRDDVWVYYDRARGGPKTGALTVGFGAGDDKIGPEFQFGHVMGRYLESRVLIVKTAWGGKSLAVDFRPPSSGRIAFEVNPRLREKIESQPDTVGHYYREMMTQVKKVLENLERHFPDYDGRGCEIAGFCWHQGWNDGCDEAFSKEYERNFTNFVRDVRKDLGVEDLPFVVANSGFGGKSETRDGVVGRLRRMVQPAQAAAAGKLENVVCVDTRDFYRSEDMSPGRGDIEHWFSNAESYFLIGDAMGEAMKTLLDPKTRSVRFDPVVQKIEGWTVYVDPQLLEGEHSEVGARALQMLANHLQRIAILLPEDRLAKMRKIEIWIEYRHPKLGAMQYHPDVGWLKRHGHDPRLAKKVHITRAETLLSRQQMVKHPAVVLHELAHAYHDQYLGFDDPRFIEAYKKAKESGDYENVLLYTGRKVRHYAMKDHKEYFAEGTEAYFYRNDFYPFVRAELKEHDPVLHDLLVEVWGTLP